MGAAALLQLAIQLLPTVTTGVEHFIAWMHTLRTSAQQSGEWSEEQDKQFLVALRAKETAPEYQPDTAAAPTIEPPPPAA